MRINSYLHKFLTIFFYTEIRKVQGNHQQRNRKIYFTEANIKFLYLLSKKEAIMNADFTPTVAGKVVPLATIRRPDTGGAVRMAQKILIFTGYLTKGAANGIFGPKTEQAVKNYQLDRTLAVDGIVGPKTWGKLTDEIPEGCC
jgi:peptidoglycan hydrolase-like protein with peptidoglycan-binding domain